MQPSLLPLFCALLSTPGAVEAPRLQLQVRVVEDPDFPPLEPKLIQAALKAAKREFALRFDAKPPRFVLLSRESAADYLKARIDPKAEGCAPLLKARYRGQSADELLPFQNKAMRFFRRWPLESLTGFLPGAAKTSTPTYSTVYAHYKRYYPARVEALKRLKTPKGSPLYQSKLTQGRSFVGWLCALKNEREADVVLTNSFILADLMSEPHPHAALGKAKVGGIAASNPYRAPLGRQVLLASTFGIDTPLSELSEVNGQPPSPDERAELLGTYLLAHELGHALFGLLDFFDHPESCLMTSRPGESYREGLAHLHAHPNACPRCQPWVKARKSLELGRSYLAQNAPDRALRELRHAIRKTPRQFHGSRRARLAEAAALSALAYDMKGDASTAQRYAKAALKLDPSQREAQTLLTRTATTAKAKAPTQAAATRAPRTKAHSESR